MEQYHKNNREEILRRHKQWAKDNPEKMKEYKEQWRENNPEHNRQWFKTDKGRIAQQKYNLNRRELGLNPLNKYFEGSEGHHINKNDIVYILKELHRSISHCLNTGRNMEKINRLAMENIGE